MHGELDNILVKFLRLQFDKISAFEEEERKKKEEPKPEHILGAIEEAYPNSLTINDMSRRFTMSQESITRMVKELVERNLVKAVGATGLADGSVDPFAAGFRRVHQGSNTIAFLTAPKIPTLTKQGHMQGW